MNGFEKDLNYGTSGLRRYSVNVNGPTLEQLLTKLSDKMQVPDDRETCCLSNREKLKRKRPAHMVSDKNLALDGEGNEVNCEDYGLEWISHLTEGDGKFIAKRELACVGQGPLSTRYFNILCHFLADTLEEVCANDTSTRVMVNEVFENDTHLFYGSEVSNGRIVGVNKNKSNSLS